jgi:hypothetical protein
LDDIGRIKHHGLHRWWEQALTDTDRMTIRTCGCDISGEPGMLTTQQPLGFVVVLLGWLTDDLATAHKVAQQGLSMVEGASIIDVHFLYSQIIHVYYRHRDQPGAMNTVLRFCDRQIEIGPQVMAAMIEEHRTGQERSAQMFGRTEPPRPFDPPSHLGFRQLCIIRTKEGKHDEVIRLCETAIAQGWMGDWQRRIERARKSLQKLGQDLP